eukprot:CAMPEP_0113588002 /NCGR_PEP_ID=MMETSP0015_2-20120614/35246_1 /TAXON_ID=2838 /ORGANISM="Odontella" /LENGTH=253 /DNA_ID=CAMNT_0000493773 /DNA_START=279 /DNA_END=1037 /DNA_ORIENTATION=+ /assembly_acc=CAM_ASM_000160
MVRPSLLKVLRCVGLRDAGTILRANPLQLPPSILEGLYILRFDGGFGTREQLPSPVVANVQPNHLLQGVGTEPPEVVQDYEEGEHDGGDPAHDEEQADHLAREEGGVGKPTHVRVRFVRIHHSRWGGKQAHNYRPPHAIQQVNGYRVDGIVEPESDKEVRADHVDHTCEEACDDGCPGFHHRAPGGDGDEAAEAAVHRVDNVEGGLPHASLDGDEIGEEGRNPPRCGSECGVDSREGGDPALDGAGYLHGGSG